MTWKICRNISNLRKMLSKFVEKCKICRKILSKWRKMLSKNIVELCRIMSNYVEKCEICRKMQNLSKNDVELSKWRKMMSKSIEMAKFVEICRIMSKFFEMAKFVENVFLDFSPYIRKEKPFMWRGLGPWDGCRKRVFGFSHLTWKKEKSFILREVYQKITRKISIKIIKWGIKS